ncbi:hypothetical protein ACGGZK_16460 [Agromyces sp. MMS24-K17]|uniref:hypothetical protein n=1 Tax=Agromyces sp. MMS24-K17 TaxID=3372850 RepID=UPI003754B230
MTRRRTGGERGAVRLDPRLLIGIVLVAGSTIGVWALVSGLDDRIQVYATRDTATPGTRLEADDLDVRSVGIDEDAAAHYVQVGDLDVDGVVVTRTVGAGELLPTGAVGTGASVDVASIVVATRGPLAVGVGAGTRVDVWSAAALEHGAYDAPTVLVPGAEIAAVIEEDGLVGGDARQVELLVPRGRVAALLQALAAGDAIDLVSARLAEGD